MLTLTSGKQKMSVDEKSVVASLALHTVLEPVLLEVREERSEV